MRIVHIIGNGFDLNLGLKTSYKDFYDFYQKIPTKSPEVEALKRDMSDQIENWSDLEYALGDYTQKTKSPDEFEKIFDDVFNQSAEYLKSEEGKLDFSKANLSKLYTDLYHPEKYLLPSDNNIMTTFSNKVYSKSNSVSIISLNYTQTLGKILTIPNGGERISKPGELDVYLNPIQHLHGQTDDRMILGVNDVSQIGNQSFNNNEDVLSFFVKPICNKASKATVDQKCIRLIQESNLICIFGCSLGDTDKFWWELIGDWLKNDNRLLLFNKSTPTNRRQIYKQVKIESKIKNFFLSKTKLSDAEKTAVMDKIFVAINTEIFSDLLG